MPKVKKLKRSKKFRVNVNRKRMRNKLRKLPNIECKQIKEAWEVKKSTVTNLERMGLAYDPNKVLKIPNLKKEMLKSMQQENEDDISDTENVVDNVPEKVHVAQSLEAEAKHPRAKLFRLPNNEVNFVTYMLDKYGDDYKAMVRDRKNYNQMTWRQIKAKIERFKSIPEQYAEYLVKKGEIVLEDPTPLKKIKPEILKETIEKKPNAKPSRRKRKQQSSIVQSIWQEESVAEDDDNVNLLGDSEKKESADNEKKLKLFSDDENDEDDDEEEDDEEIDEDDDLEEDFSDSEESVQEVKLNKVEKGKNSKKSAKTVVSKDKTKKLKVK